METILIDGDPNVLTCELYRDGDTLYVALPYESGGYHVYTETLQPGLPDSALVGVFHLPAFMVYEGERTRTLPAGTHLGTYDTAVILANGAAYQRLTPRA